MNSNLLSTQVFLICLMLVGFICTKVRLIDDKSRSSLTDLILCIFLPATILSSFFDTGRSALPVLGLMILISTFIMVLCYVLSKFLLFRGVELERKKVLVFATIISNASFIGTPVIEGIYGTDALIYVAAYLIPLRASVWTVGLALFSGEKGSIKKVVLHPCMVATYLGLLVMLTAYTPFPLLSRVMSSLGSCTTPMSMLVVGSILGVVKSEKLFTRMIAYFTFIRLLLIPLIVMGILILLRIDPIITGVSVVLSGTPAGSTTSILADKYGADREFASKIVFLSTLLSIVTIPALIWLLQYL